MLAAVLHAPQDLRMEERPDAAPGPGEVSLRILAAAICGSDRKAYLEGHPRMTLPRVVGHELCGVVEAADSGGAFREGERVTIQPAVPDGACGRCREGFPELCESPSLAGYHFDGAFGQRMVVPAAVIERGCLLRVPAGVPDDEAALAEPFACALHAVSLLRAPVAPGRFAPCFAEGLPAGAAAAVLGAGPMGCLLSISLRMLGARPFLFDVDAGRLAVAVRACRPEGSAVVPAEALAAAETVRAALRTSTGSDRADAAVAACPSPAAQRAACEIVRRGGSVSLFGGLPPDAPASLNSNRIHYGTLSVVGGSGCSADHMREALSLLARREADLSPLITKRIPLEGLEEALRASAPGDLKVIVRPRGSTPAHPPRSRCRC